jgi:hypothetical protein
LLGVLLTLTFARAVFSECGGDHLEVARNHMPNAVDALNDSGFPETHQRSLESLGPHRERDSKFDGSRPVPAAQRAQNPPCGLSEGAPT